MRRAASLALAGLAGVLLAACAGSANRTNVPPEEQAPWATVEVAMDVHGNARVSVLAAGLHLDAVRALTADVAASVFPAAPAGDVKVLGLAGSSTVPTPVQGVIRVPGAVPAGPSPSFSVDGAALEGRLRAAGADTTRLSICLPAVPVTTTVDPPTPMVAVGGCRLWLPGRSAALPSVRVSLRPEAWRWESGLLGSFLALALAALGLVRRSRSAALASVVVLLATVSLGLGGLDDAKVAGLLGGGSILDVGWTAAALAGALAGLGAVVALIRRREREAPALPAPPPVSVH